MSKEASNTQLTHALTSANNENKSFLKTWQLALAIGIPSAVVIGYFIYKRRGQSNKQKTINEAKKDEKTTSIVTSVERKEELPSKTRLERSVDIKNDGNKFFQLKKYNEALECYSKAIEICPEDNRDELSKFYQNRAAAYENLKIYKKVIEDCNKALELDPNYTKALLRRAKAFEQVEEYQMAFEDLTMLCILENFQNAKSMQYAEKLVAILGERMFKEEINKRSWVPISKQFVDNFYIGITNDPIYNNKQLLVDIESNENKEEIKTILNAINEFNKGNYEECIGYCKNEIDSNGKYVMEALNLRGSLYMLRCQNNETMKDLNRLLAFENASKRMKSNALIKIATANMQVKNLYEAFVNFEKAIEIDENNEDIYCHRAQVHANEKRFDDCFKDFDKTLQLNPDNKIAIIQKSFFKYYQLRSITCERFADANQNEEASEKLRLKLVEDASKLEPVLEKYNDIAEGYSLLAQIYSELRDFDKAERYYKVSLEIDPLNSGSIVNRALNQIQMTNDFESSISMIQEATKIDETSSYPYAALANIEIQRGNLVKAIELYEKAIRRSRDEEQMLSLCSMLVGTQAQIKVLSKLQFSSEAFNIVSNAGRN